MKITSSLFHAHIKCPTKCWLRFTGEPATGNPYAEWVQSRNESYRKSEIERLRSEVPPDERADAPKQESLKTSKWRMGFDVSVATSQNLETCLQAVERAPSESRGKSARFIPIRFVFTNKLGNDEKMLLTYDAYVLSQVFGHEVSLGKIVHGDSHATLTVKTSTLAGDLRKRLDKITALLSNPTPPDLVLNRHCAECEFQPRCRQKGLEKDDLSLLAGMSAKEREHYRNKGIFTVNQLSYTFRPRRPPKRAKNPAKPRYLALQALAVRENTVYFHGLPVMPAPNTKVFLDIEGLPDRDFYYLIGALVVSDGHETFHSFWADAESDQATMFTTIDLCLSLFPWARFRSTKAAIKLHTLLDLRGPIPTMISISEGKRADVNILDELILEPGAFYVMDRGYVDFARLFRFVLAGAFFVTRAKTNLQFNRLESRPVEESAGVRSDQAVWLTLAKSIEHCSPLSQGC